MAARGPRRAEAPDVDVVAGDGDTEGRKLVVTLGAEAAAATRRMAADLDVSTAEAVRRGLALLDVLQSLGPEEELVVRNTRSGEIERLRFHWGY